MKPTTLEALKEMPDVQWHPNKMASARFVKFGEALDNEGDVIYGRLVHYHPSSGAQNFDRTGDVGLLVLEDDEGKWWKIGLEKGALASAVNGAFISLADRSLTDPTYIAIQFSGMSDTEPPYKMFKAWAGEGC